MKVFRRATKKGIFCFCSAPVFGPDTPTCVVVVLVRVLVLVGVVIPI